MTESKLYEEAVQATQKYRSLKLQELLSIKPEFLQTIKSLAIVLQDDGLIIRYEHSNKDIIEFGYKGLMYISGASRITIQISDGVAYMYNIQKKYIYEVEEQIKLINTYRDDVNSAEWFPILFFQCLNTPDKIKKIAKILSTEPKFLNK